jgi:hypothetical protein
MTARLSAIIPNRSSDQSPVYLRDQTGRLIRELSPTTGEVRPSRALAPASGMWSAPLWVAESYFVDSEGYDVMLVDTLGGARQTFRRRAEWWHSRESAPAPGYFSTADSIRRVPTSVVGVREDKRGRLLVLVSHASPSWKGVTRTSQFQEANYVAILEVIEPKTRRLLASFRVNGFPRSVISDNRFVTYREDRDGYPYLDVWRFNVP